MSIVVGNLQSASQEQKTILDQAFNHIATHERLLENIHKDLQPFQGRELLPERQLPTPKRLGAPVTQSTNTDSTSEENTPWSTIIALRLKERVKVNCKCSCHRQKRIQSLSCLSHIFGSLFIGYVGIPGVSTECGFKHSCCKHVDRKGSMICMFPLWFAALVIMVGMEFS